MNFKNLREYFKVLIIYFISNVISVLVVPLFVKNEFSREEYKNYLIPIIIFTIIYIILISIFKVNKKAVIVSFIVIYFLVSTLLISDVFSMKGLTPNDVSFLGVQYITFISLYTTLPFQMLIYMLMGYNIEDYSYIILAIYLIVMSIIIYIIDKFRDFKETNKKRV